MPIKDYRSIYLDDSLVNVIFLFEIFAGKTKIQRNEINALPSTSPDVLSVPVRQFQSQRENRLQTLTYRIHIPLVHLSGDPIVAI